jgi:hypothetical protein
MRTRILSTSPADIDAGELPTSFYRGDLDSLFLLGDAGTDTEEFDDHVVVHEWGHYFEDVFSRSDSIGGSHSIGQRIDARLAFGEGWATALAAMALDDPQYCDTFVPGTSGGFGIDTENNNSGSQGWFNEMSVATFLYDLWDTVADGSDTVLIRYRASLDAEWRGARICRCPVGAREYRNHRHRYLGYHPVEYHDIAKPGP